MKYRLHIYIKAVSWRSARISELAQKVEWKMDKLRIGPFGGTMEGLGWGHVMIHWRAQKKVKSREGNVRHIGEGAEDIMSQSHSKWIQKCSSWEARTKHRRDAQCPASGPFVSLLSFSPSIFQGYNTYGNKAFLGSGNTHTPCFVTL